VSYLSLNILSPSLLTRQVNQYLAQQRLEVKRELPETKKNKNSAMRAIPDKMTVTSNMPRCYHPHSSPSVSLLFHTLRHASPEGLERLTGCGNRCDDDGDGTPGLALGEAEWDELKQGVAE